MPPIIAVSGVKNSGKTTLVERLVSSLTRHGLLVATIKHDAHEFDPDVPGRDSYRHRAAGAYGTAVFDGEKYMVIKQAKASIEQMVVEFPEADIILLEGAKQTEYPKLEIVRKGNSKEPVCDPRMLLALVTDLPSARESVPSSVPSYDINDIQGLTELILRYCASQGSLVSPIPLCPASHTHG